MTDRRRALVTGGAVRLGRAIALDLARTGWDVAIHFLRSGGAADRTAAEIRDLGGAAATLRADLLDEAETGALVARAAGGLGGPLSLLVNNASIFEPDRVGTITRRSWDRAIESNLRAPVRLTQDFAAQAPDPARDARGEPVARAVVINMIDQRVLRPTPAFQSYLVAKSALLAFTQTSAQALAPRVRVGAIGPGPTIAAARQSDENFMAQRAACVLQRGSDPEDITSAMQFILSNKAFTGQMIAVDGGQHLCWRTPDVVVGMKDAER